MINQQTHGSPESRHSFVPPNGPKAKRGGPYESFYPTVVTEQATAAGLLREPVVLDDSIPLEALPRTVRDAITDLSNL